jgi:hypothetical protein
LFILVVAFVMTNLPVKRKNGKRDSQKEQESATADAHFVRAPPLARREFTGATPSHLAQSKNS